MILFDRATSNEVLLPFESTFHSSPVNILQEKSHRSLTNFIFRSLVGILCFLFLQICCEQHLVLSLRLRLSLSLRSPRMVQNENYWWLMNCHLRDIPAMPVLQTNALVGLVETTDFSTRKKFYLSQKNKCRKNILRNSSGKCLFELDKIDVLGKHRVPTFFPR